MRNYSPLVPHLTKFFAINTEPKNLNTNAI